MTRKEELFQTQVQEFLNYLKFERRYSPLTIRCYHDDLRQFCEFLADQYNLTTHSLAEISHLFIRSWLASLKEGKMTSRTINRKISSLRSFFKYHIRTGNVEENPMTVIHASKVSRRLPTFLEQKDIAILLNDLEFPDTWAGKSDHLMLAIFYNTGLRLSELINLKERNIDASSIKVTGKGDKERIIPISSQLYGQIAQYIEDKKKLGPSVDRIRLIVNENGKQVNAKHVYLVVKKYLALVTTVSKKSPHVLRHTFATHLSNNGADLNSIKELLGHSSLAATQIYTHNTIEKLKDAYKKAHPRG